MYILITIPTLSVLAIALRYFIFSIDKLAEQASYRGYMIELRLRESHEHLQSYLQ